VTVYGNNLCGNGISSSLAVTVNPIPPTPVITASWASLSSDAPAGNQWYLEGTMIPGATGQYYIATQIGHYWDVVTLNGCSSDTSNHIYILIIGIQDKNTGTLVDLYPNPGDGLFLLQVLTKQAMTFDIAVYNNLGVNIRSFNHFNVNSSMSQILDLSSEPAGVYTIILRTNDGIITRKLVINK
jgi:hypothetical protein